MVTRALGTVTLPWMVGSTAGRHTCMGHVACGTMHEVATCGQCGYDFKRCRKQHTLRVRNNQLVHVLVTTLFSGRQHLLGVEEDKLVSVHGKSCKQYAPGHASDARADPLRDLCGLQRGQFATSCRIVCGFRTSIANMLEKRLGVLPPRRGSFAGCLGLAGQRRSVIDPTVQNRKRRSFHQAFAIFPKLFRCMQSLLSTVHVVIVRGIV